MIFTSVAGLLGGIAAAFLSYKNGKRAASGNVDTSDARTVWERSEVAYKFMKDLYEARINDLETANAELRVLVHTLQEKVLVLESKIASFYTKTQSDDHFEEKRNAWSIRCYARC